MAGEFGLGTRFHGVALALAGLAFRTQADDRYAIRCARGQIQRFSGIRRKCYHIACATAFRAVQDPIDFGAGSCVDDPNLAGPIRFRVRNPDPAHRASAVPDGHARCAKHFFSSNEVRVRLRGLRPERIQHVFPVACSTALTVRISNSTRTKRQDGQSNDQALQHGQHFRIRRSVDLAPARKDAGIRTRPAYRIS